MIAYALVVWGSAQVLLSLLAPTATPSHAVSHQTNCFAQPSRCGYPDASNTGVPRGTSLKPSGPITVTRSGTMLEGLSVTGTVNVAADDVTIKDSRIVQRPGEEGGATVTLERGADNFRLEDSEVGGNGSRTHAPESGVWNHYNNPGARVIRSYIHGSPDNWEGRVDLVKDSYMVVDASLPGSHDENIYIWCTTVNVDHSTLINRHEQTATVFGDTLDCEGNRFTVTNSLLAGGGFTLYPQAASEDHPVPNARTRVTGNRFARCQGGKVYNDDSGGTACQGGADPHGLFPYGGYFGVLAGYFRGKDQVWKKNVWDDNLRPACFGSC